MTTKTALRAMRGDSAGGRSHEQCEMRRAMATGPDCPKIRRVALLAACTPAVGSDAWCKPMDATPKADWSANDVAAYAKHCVLGLRPDEQ